MLQLVFEIYRVCVSCFNHTDGNADHSLWYQDVNCYPLTLETVQNEVLTHTHLLGMTNSILQLISLLLCGGASYHDCDTCDSVPMFHALFSLLELWTKDNDVCVMSYSNVIRRKGTRSKKAHVIKRNIFANVKQTLPWDIVTFLRRSIHSATHGSSASAIRLLRLIFSMMRSALTPLRHVCNTQRARALLYLIYVESESDSESASASPLLLASENFFATEIDRLMHLDTTHLDNRLQDDYHAALVAIYELLADMFLLQTQRNATANDDARTCNRVVITQHILTLHKILDELDLIHRVPQFALDQISKGIQSRFTCGTKTFNVERDTLKQMSDVFGVGNSQRIEEWDSLVHVSRQETTVSTSVRPVGHKKRARRGQETHVTKRVRVTHEYTTTTNSNNNNNNNSYRNLFGSFGDEHEYEYDTVNTSLSEQIGHVHDYHFEEESIFYGGDGHNNQPSMHPSPPPLPPSPPPPPSPPSPPPPPSPPSPPPPQLPMPTLTTTNIVLPISNEQVINLGNEWLVLSKSLHGIAKEMDHVTSVIQKAYDSIQDLIYKSEKHVTSDK